MMLHYHLGHPNIPYFACLYPALFLIKSQFFRCEVYQLLRHTRAQILPHTYSPSQPFSLIQGDIWGPSRVKNIMGHDGFFF